MLRSGLLQRTPRGRVATLSTYRHLGRTSPRGLRVADAEPPPTLLDAPAEGAPGPHR
jgi:hypothetical protein